MDLSFNNIIFAFLLTLLAGLSTGIGSFIGFFAKRTNIKFLSFSLGFSAGVMIYVSFIEIFPEALEVLIEELGESKGYLITVLSFFLGIAFIAIIDRLIPNYENPHELPSLKEIKDIKSNNIDTNKLHRMGIFTALAIAIHNFPEGLATFLIALNDPAIGITIAIAIAIHNIPEGIAVFVPIYYATGNRRKAFAYSFLSGMAEPLGAIIGFLVLLPFLNDIIFGILFSSVAGIMVFISLDELLPSAQEYGHHHLSIYGLILGMMVMAISLILLH